MGNEPPHEVGTVFTPVRASECVHLRSKKKKSVRKVRVVWRRVASDLKQIREVKTQRP